MTTFMIIKLVLSVAIIGAFCYIMYDYRQVKIENDRLSNEIKTANATITALDNLAKKNAEIDKNTDTLIDKIEKEPKENDADTAPVLLNAIMRLHR
jgi:hypothetical protein